jgi:hypothetical protein
MPSIRHFWWLILTFAFACGQKTANEVVPDSPSAFDFGVNLGYYPPHFTDTALAALAHGTPDVSRQGIGATSIRVGLFDYFLDAWGVSARADCFRFYDDIGLRQTVVISGFPAERHRDTTCYCPGQPGQMFRQMYAPIWDNGENGTPVNDSNVYALYLWEAALAYKGRVAIWEVWNEPDAGSNAGWLPSGTPGNWWDVAPHPCDVAFQAPVFHYIRALRITYEVVKFVDPQAFVAIGGVGWPSFLDAVCRYSDNPDGGDIDPKNYPRQGGAYFDCMSFHAYPHLHEDVYVPEYRGDSDALSHSFWARQEALRAVLEAYGYDGGRYPMKRWICSEFNIPRNSVDRFMGSDALQVNFLIKTLVAAQKKGVTQMHLYALSDDDSDPALSAMGLFHHLGNTAVARPHDLAFAFKTTSDLLRTTRYDPVRTLALRLPATLEGAAFRHVDGHYTYVLWCLTTAASGENARASLSLPARFRDCQLAARGWDFSKTNKVSIVSPDTLRLTGTPLFFTETAEIHR